MSARTYSFEFFPPKTPEGTVKLRNVRTQLAALKPDFFSVTFGAGGSTREGTWNSVVEIHQAGLPAAPHISCVGSSRALISKLLSGYRETGIRRLVALRGDAPSGTGTGGGELTYASELVEFVREQSGDWFHIEVAAYPEYHPQSRSPAEDLANFVRKVRAGANSAITQYFYNADAYYHFVDQCEAMDIRVPIVPGIMPIVRFVQLARFSDACGAEIPRWIRNKLAAYGDDSASIRAFGLDVVTRLCDDLLRSGAPGLHFYTLNQAGLTSTIWQRLGL
jgi:methylenetetrahydrofolate reductase (NADH)